METLGIIICVIIAVMFLKTSLRKGAKFLEQVVDVNINEEQADMIERSMNAYDEVIDRCGENFKTPSEVLALLMKNKRRQSQQV